MSETNSTLHMPCQSEIAKLKEENFVLVVGGLSIKRKHDALLEAAKRVTAHIGSPGISGVGGSFSTDLKELENIITYPVIVSLSSKKGQNETA